MTDNQIDTIKRILKEFKDQIVALNKKVEAQEKRLSELERSYNIRNTVLR